MRRVCISLVGLLIASSAFAQNGAPNGEWRTYGGDLGNTRYAPLDQITKDNFNKLEVAWHFKADALGPALEYNWESTPLMVGGVVYVTAGSRRAVVALDAASGEMLWLPNEADVCTRTAATSTTHGYPLQAVHVRSMAPADYTRARMARSVPSVAFAPDEVVEEPCRTST